jgi:hypothetical protein
MQNNTNASKDVLMDSGCKNSPEEINGARTKTFFTHCLGRNKRMSQINESKPIPPSSFKILQTPIQVLLP